MARQNLTLNAAAFLLTFALSSCHTDSNNRGASVKPVPSNAVVHVPAAAPNPGASALVPTSAAEPESLTTSKASALPSLVGGLPHYFPTTASASQKKPLVLFLHGLGATGKLSFDVLKLREFGERHQVFVVAPDGSRNSRGQQFWDAHPACCNFDTEPVDHVAYLSSLVDELTKSHFVDPSRIFVMGFSNGGFMAHRLACAWGDRLAGIVSVAGSGPVPTQVCRTPKHLRILEMHGDADKTVLYEGGTLFDRPSANYAGARETVEQWGRRLQCDPKPTQAAPFDLIPTLEGAETAPLSYVHCAHGTVSLWTVHGGSHLFGNRPSVLEKAWLYLNPDSGFSQL